MSRDCELEPFCLEAMLISETMRLDQFLGWYWHVLYLKMQRNPNATLGLRCIFRYRCNVPRKNTQKNHEEDIGLAINLQHTDQVASILRVRVYLSHFQDKLRNI